MKVLVTGGTGLFGIALLEWLAERRSEAEGSEITIVSRHPEQFMARHGDLCDRARVTLMRGDVLDRKSLLGGDGYSHILHAATESTFGPRLSASERFGQIVEGTKNVLGLAREVRAERFLLVSSGGVYGRTEKECPIKETERLGLDVTDPEMAYCVGKVAAEHMTAIACRESGISYTIARCFSFFGPHLPRDAHFAVGNFIKAALEKRDIRIFGDGLAVRSYMYESDWAEWLWRLTVRGRSGEIYNVGSQEAITILDLARMVREVSRREIAVQVLGRDKSGARNYYVPCAEKAITQMGLSVRVSLKEGLQRTFLREDAGWAARLPR